MTYEGSGDIGIVLLCFIFFGLGCLVCAFIDWLSATVFKDKL